METNTVIYIFSNDLIRLLKKETSLLMSKNNQYPVEKNGMNMISDTFCLNNKKQCFLIYRSELYKKIGNKLILLPIFFEFK